MYEPYVYIKTNTYTQRNKQTNKQTYIHTYLHAYIHTQIQTYIHTYIQTYIHTYIHTKQYMSNLESPGFTEKTPTNFGRSHRLPHVRTIVKNGKLGGYRLQEESMIHLTPGPEAVLPFWSGIFAAGLWAIWGGATGRGDLLCKSPFPHRQHRQPACWTATSTQTLYSELSSSPGFETWMLWRLPALQCLQTRTFARKNVRENASLSICLSG